MCSFAAIYHMHARTRAYNDETNYNYLLGMCRYLYLTLQAGRLASVSMADWLTDDLSAVIRGCSIYDNMFSLAALPLSASSTPAATALALRKHFNYCCSSSCCSC